MNEPSDVRRYVREILAHAPKRMLSERMLFEGVSRLTRDTLRVDELKAAIQFNVAGGFASETKEDPDDPTSVEVYQITPAGLRKEKLA